MTLVVYAEGRDGSNPGHMVVGQEPERGLPRYFGYRFDPADLPMEAQAPEHWREYLFTHTVPGRIVDETRYVSHVLVVGGRTFFEKRAACAAVIETRLPPRERWMPYALYSFNPDDFHSVDRPCYNCVKWAIVVANGLVDGFLPLVRQGRVKEVLKHLEQRDG
jgi:hypothetical protein